MNQREAGRDLDARIVVQVFDWRDVRRMGPQEPFGGDYAGFPPDDLHTLSLVPWFSTDMGAAWQIAVHLREAGWCVELYTEPKILGAVTLYYWRADIDQSTQIAEQADTVPLALCLAALAAVGKEG